MKIRNIYLLLSAVVLLLGVACNKSDDYNYPVSQNTLVKTFALADKSTVMENLSKVYFTIDARQGKIFNADSLPMGTKVVALAANITFDSPSKVEVQYYDSRNQAEIKTIDYMANSNDTIDFTYPVTINVTAADGETVQKYEVDLRVHRSIPDSLWWSEISAADLPTSLTPIRQKSLEFQNKIYCFTTDASGNYEVGVSATPSDLGSWQKSSFNPGFVLNMATIQATEDAFYALAGDSDQKALYKSTDGKLWTLAEGNQTFYTLIGSYGEQILGIIKDGGVYKHDVYPRPEGYIQQPISPLFPISGFSNMIEIFDGGDFGVPQNGIVGGRLQDGTLTSAVWGYDGQNWAVLGNQSLITPREGAMFFPYYTFIYDSETAVHTKYKTFFVIGGKNETGCLKDVYTTTDPAVYWDLAPAGSLLALPPDDNYFPAKAFASVVVFDEPIITVRSSAWRTLFKKEIPRRLAGSTRSGELVPYIYMFGGENQNGVLYPQIWRGVINRVTFAPIP